VTNDRSPIRILCVDDHALVRDGIAALLCSQADMHVVAVAGSGLEALEEFRKHRPDVTLMDLRMSDMSGIDAMAAILQDHPHARFIILTTYSGDVEIVRALRAGAQAYLLKGHLRKELFDTIRAVHEGRRRIPPEIALQIADHTADSPLSAREVGVLQLIAAGNANKLVADKLSISEDTVKGHVKSILSKLGARDRTHAVTIALKRGIIEL
jgi:DNA-binding NarL/FixJ family response regulator